MATPRRRGPGRWLVTVLGVASAVAFLGAILGGPQPSNASPPAASPEQTEGVSPPGTRASSSDLPSYSVPSYSVPSYSPPRLRSRGS